MSAALDDMDIAALRAVWATVDWPSTANVQSNHDGPLPVQRLTGLQRRGYVWFDCGYWRLTAKGDLALREAAAA